jgi:predicted  nucleic acid-binding Zn-ribbon protein
MQDVLRALRGIQDLDLDIFQVTREYERLPAERDARRSELDARIARRNELESELRTLKAEIKEIEDHTTVQRQRLRKVEGEAAKARSDAALLAAFQHERQTLRREIGEAEEEGLQFVERAEEIEGRLQVMDKAIAEDEAVYAEFAGNAEREIAEAEKKLAALKAERAERLGTQISHDVLEIYERLLQAREGVALAELEGRVCQGCYMEVPANVFVKLSRGIELVQCPSCDRILYLEG